jgi:hypothetical protein
MTKDDLVGVWREVGRELIQSDGTVKRDIPRASQIIYTADGYMSVVNAPRNRGAVTETDGRMDLNAASAQARAEAATGVVAYAGRYEIKGDLVFHHIFTSLNPNRVGEAQERRATLSGDDLTLAAPPDAKGATFRIQWRKAAKMPE